MGVSRFLRIAAAFTVAVALSHCTAPTGTATPAASVADSSSDISPAVQASATHEQQDAAQASTLPSSGAPTTGAASSDYRIGPRDSLKITVFQVPDLSGSGVLVDSGGNVVMPLIGAVHVAGLTTDQAGNVIAKKLGKTYLQNPQVFVILQKSGKRIIVSGAVAKPTAIPAAGGLTLSQAVVTAGGLSDVANPERVHVARVTGHRVKDAVYNLSAVFAGQAPDPNVYGGDMIVAEKSGTRVALKTVKDLLPFTALVGLVAGL